jgi:hypothetical protein
MMLQKIYILICPIIFVIIKTCRNVVFDYFTKAFNMLLEILLLFGCIDGGEMHPVEPAVLLGLVPVSLQITKKYISEQVSICNSSPFCSLSVSTVRGVMHPLKSAVA